MNYLTLENISKSYGEKILFEKISLSVNKGQKVAFVARNGSGKSTLLRVIAGLEGAEGEQAKVLISKGIRIGFLDQDPNFDDNTTVIEAVLDNDENPMVQAVRNYEDALLEPENEAKMKLAISQMEKYSAWDFESKIKEILFKLQVNDLFQELGTMSGGQQKRVALAKLIIDEPEFIILDEPTNHLDLEMVEWLEKYLSSTNLTIFMVTHDRYFLDRVCNTILELDRGEIFKYKGNYTDFLEQKALRKEIEVRTVDKAKRMMTDELEWVRRMPQGRGTKAKARLDAFDDLKKKASKKVKEDSFTFNIKQTRLGKTIVELYNVSKGYDDKNLIENFNYKFQKGERVGIVGNNGSGKSTFLRLITNEIRPDKGKIKLGLTVQFGHYKQDGLQFKENQLVIDVINEIAPFIELGNGAKMYAAQFLELFLFPKAQHRMHVEKLSGGERRRLYLLTVLLQNPNFLILDEPTNDLDILTLNVLEQFLMEFEGCLIIVSHDRYFLDKLVDHLFIFEGNGVVRDFNGTYSRYRLDKKERELEAKRIEKAAKEATKTQPERTKEKQKLSYSEQQEFKKLEKAIIKLETRKEEITAMFSDTSLDSDKIVELSKEIQEIEKDLEVKEERWMELAEWA
ncbi:MAG: ABC-F family ATP-binding cassette domain-containing protein [Saprospiraceae bacterium]